jgi:F-type H+-transporting ATPase subunit delta
MLADIVATMKLSAGIHNFLGLLLEKDRLKFLDQIMEDYQKLADELSGVVRARITAAAPLEDSQQQVLKGGLERQTGKKVELKVDFNPSLIGGLQAEIAGRVFDGSVRTQLKRIEDTLKKG